MKRNQIRSARRKVKVPRARDQSGGHDPVQEFISLHGRLTVVASYQVAAQTTPSPLS